MTYDERVFVERFLEQDIPEAEWVGFVGRQQKALNTFRDRVDDGDVEVATSYLANAFEADRDARRRVRRAEVAVPVKDPRWAALARILAIRANRDRDVVEFRRTHLGSGLISFEEVADWIKASADAEGPPTTWVTVPMGDDGRPVTLKAAMKAGTLSTHSELLQYLEPGSSWKRAIPTRYGGVLWELKRLAARLGAGFAWSEPIAVTFVLTGEAPKHPMTFGSTQHAGPLPSTDWVELRVNPAAVAPEALSIAYRQIRQAMIGGGASDRRVRPLAEKAATLAVFWEEMGGPHGKGVGELRIAWNRRHPKWRYPDSSNFGRDARNAHQNVVGESSDSLPPWLASETEIESRQ